MAQQYRAIVIGCGAVGAATTYWLSRQLGSGVLALEQYWPGHSRGASEDHSRVIRHAYSRTEYTALTPAAYQSWNVAEHIALHDPESGILDIRRATAAHIALARDRGATVLAGAEVTAIVESAGT